VCVHPQARLDSGSSGEWKDDGCDVLADGLVVGRIMKAIAAPEGKPWLWAVAHGFIAIIAGRRTGKKKSKSGRKSPAGAGPEFAFMRVAHETTTAACHVL
jgi:hypothetical protein